MAGRPETGPFSGKRTLRFELFMVLLMIAAGVGIYLLLHGQDVSHQLDRIGLGPNGQPTLVGNAHLTLRHLAAFGLMIVEAVLGIIALLGLRERY